MESKVSLQTAIAIIENAFESTKTYLLSLRCHFYNFRKHLCLGSISSTDGIRDADDIVSDNEKDELKLFLNRTKVHIEFKDDVANMSDVYDVITEDEIHNSKIK